MASRKGRDLRQEFLTCSLCKNLYDNEERVAKCLPCLHCFCKACLTRTIDGQTNVKCPDCRKEHNVSEDGVNGFVTNFIVENLREFQSLQPRLEQNEGGEQKCTSCNADNPATDFCHDCNSFVCQTCTEMHTNMKVLRFHDIESMDSIQNPDRPLRRRKSTYDSCLHGQDRKPFSIFCKTCKKPICDTCGHIAPHSNHDKVDLNEAVEEAVGELRKMSDAVANRKEPMEKQYAMIDTRINDINTLFRRQEEEIDNIFQNLEGLLRDRSTKAKEELKGCCQTQTKLLKEQKDNVEALVAQCDSACEFANQTCEHASPTQLFTHQEMIVQRLEGLLSQNTSHTEPVANNFLDFHDDHHDAMKLVEDTFASIGRTRTSDTLASLCYLEDLKPNVTLGSPQIVQLCAVNYNKKPQETGGDPFTAELQAPNGTAIACKVVDNKDGTYKLSYTPNLPGTYLLDIRVFGRPIHHSPFAIDVANDVSDDLMIHGVNVEINRSVALVGYSHQILVNISNEDDVEEAKVNRIHANIETQTGDSVKYTCHASDDDSDHYVIEYTPPVDGPLNAIITVNDVPATGNPYTIHVQPGSPKASIVALGRPVSNQLWSIRVSPRDYRQNPISVDENSVHVKVTNLAKNTEQIMTCKRNKDSDLIFTCIPTAATYLVKAFLHDIPIMEEHIDVPQFMEINLAETSKSFPTSVTSGVGDSLFVSDTVDGNVHRLSINLERESNVPVDKNKSSEIAIDGQGRLLLLFPQIKMIHTIDQQGHELSRWPCQKRNSRPVTILSSRGGRVIIADSKIPFMYIYKSDGELINTQELPEKAIKDGVKNICVDKRGSIVIAHHSQPKIFVYYSDGKPRCQFASGATSCQLAVACTDEDILLVAQLGAIRMIHFSGDETSIVGEIPLVSGHIFTGLISTNDGCLVGLDVGRKRLAKYGIRNNDFHKKL